MAETVRVRGSTSLFAACALVLCAPGALAEPGVYADDPAIVKTLQALGDNTSALLPPFALAGKEIEKWRGEFSRGPYRRDYGNKMVYAPERETAMYCGANHGAPHRYNDVWEYHLGSNTWNLLFAPDGDNHARAYQAREASQKPGDAEGAAFLKKWYRDVVVFKAGYFQTKNGGPVEPWHTWSGVTYDAHAKRLIWATLNNDAVESERLKEYARITRQPADELQRQLRPGTSLWLFDPKSVRWQRQLGDGPRPKTQAQGGFLEFLPDLKRSVWYTAEWYDNSGMWTYDGQANRWQNLLPNGGLEIYGNNQPDKPSRDIFPPQEMQAAYSAKHRKIVAVLGGGVWVYDVDKNAWSRKRSDDRIEARNSQTVFAYDEASDVFLLLDPRPEIASLHAYSISNDRWEKINPKGSGITAGKGTGYYDPKHNAFVVYLGQERTWVYRYRAKPSL
jgi:hypothetical protein